MIIIDPAMISILALCVVAGWIISKPVLYTLKPYIS